MFPRSFLEATGSLRRSYEELNWSVTGADGAIEDIMDIAAETTRG